MTGVCCGELLDGGAMDDALALDTAADAGGKAAGFGVDGREAMLLIGLRMLDVDASASSSFSSSCSQVLNLAAAFSIAEADRAHVLPDASEKLGISLEVRKSAECEVESSNHDEKSFSPDASGEGERELEVCSIAAAEGLTNARLTGNAGLRARVGLSVEPAAT